MQKMRLIFLAFGALTFVNSVTAFAMPAVGDSATYTVTVNTSSQTVTSTETVTVIAFDSGKSQFKVETTVTTPGAEPQITDRWVSSENLTSNFLASQTSSHCRQISGQVQSVATPAGSFSSCVISTVGQKARGQIWMGFVPFGVLKNVTVVDQTTTTKILTNYQFGR